jgi:hypothetical protein
MFIKPPETLPLGGISFCFGREKFYLIICHFYSKRPLETLQTENATSNK